MSICSPSMPAVWEMLTISCRLTNMGLKSRSGEDLRDYWKGGIRSYLGTTTSGFPNAFMCYTPFAPTALSNGTSIIEVQCDFAVAAIKKVLDSEREEEEGSQGQGRKIKSVEPTHEAEDGWEAYVGAQNAPTLMPFTESWWTGANIPGKRSQMLTYLRGLNVYEEEIRAKLEGWEGFDVRYWGEEADSATPQVAAEAGALKRKAENISEGEYSQKDVDEASEAREVLRPTAVT